MSARKAPRSKALSFLVTIFVLMLISFSAVVLWHYNMFAFRHAARQVPIPRAYKEQFQKEIEKYRVELVKFFPFTEENALKGWEEKVFKGKVVYLVEKEKALAYVRAESSGAASALYYKLKLDARKKHPVISWKWNVEKFPVKKSPEDLENQDEDDFAGRVYVIFPAAFILNSKVLEYIWAEKIPVGTIGTSALSKNIKRIVVRSGRDPANNWYREERDVLADYLATFTEAPEHDIGAVAFMTNAEHTGTDAVSMYTDIKLGYKEDGDKGGSIHGE